MGYMKKFWLSLGSVIMAGSVLIGGASWVAADETPVNTYTTDSQRNPSVAMDADGDFVVTWESYGQSNPDFPHNAMYDVYAQRFSSSGDPAGPEFPVYASSYDQKNPVVAIDSDGNFTIAFEYHKYDGGVGIWAYRYNSNGSFAGNMIIASEYPAKQYPSIAMADGSGNFTVTWDGLDDSSYGIYGRRYRGDGVLYVDTFQVNTTETSVQTKSSVGMDNASNLLVAWESHGGQDGDGIGVFAQMYAYGATKSGVEFQVNTTTEGNQTNPSAAMSWGGRGVVVWESSSSDGNLNTYDIYGQA